MRHGGLNSDVMFLPTIAPATVRGKCTNKKIAIMSWREWMTEEEVEVERFVRSNEK